MPASTAGKRHRRTPSFSNRVSPDCSGANGTVAQDGFLEELALVHRQRGTRHIGAYGAADHEPCGLCTPSPLFQHPGRQRRVAHRLAGGDVGAISHSAMSAQPAACQVSNGPCVPAETPAHGEIEVAGIVGDVFELHGGVMENVAEDRPQELRLRVPSRHAARRSFSGRVRCPSGWPAPRRNEFAARGRGNPAGQGPAPDLPCRPCGRCRSLVFWPRAPLRDQRGQPGRRGEMRMPRIVGQRVRASFHDMGQRIEADHVRGAVGGALRAADLRAGQRIDHIEAQTEGWV
jgi:hypothetical protein